MSTYLWNSPFFVHVPLLQNNKRMNAELCSLMGWFLKTQREINLTCANLVLAIGEGYASTSKTNKNTCYKVTVCH